MLAPLSALLLTLTLSAHAAYDSVWDFRGNVPGRWDVEGLAVAQPTEFGLRIQTTQDGKMKRLTDHTHPMQAVSLLVASAQNTEAIFFWRVTGENGDEFVQLPFVIPHSQTPVSVDIDVSFYPQWDPMTKEVGLQLPAGTDILLQTITLRGWTPQEQAWEAVKSFWHPDAFRPYSINFLWGPLITFNPVGTAQMFQSLPSRGMSAVRLFYFLIAIGAGISIGMLLTKRRSPWLLALPVALAASWLIFDLRMGGEILWYAYRDVRDYVGKPLETANFRTHGGFYNIVAEAMPDLLRHDRYILLDDPKSPFYSNLRYMTYPSLPIRAETATGVSLWFVYNRPDIGLDEQGRLLMLTPGGSKILAASGAVLRGFDAHTFLYETPQ